MGVYFAAGACGEDCPSDGTMTVQLQHYILAQVTSSIKLPQKTRGTLEGCNAVYIQVFD